MNGMYRIAEKNIGIDTLYEDTHRLCSNYACDGEADFHIAVCQADIDFERQKSKQESIAEGLPVIDYPDGYLETLAVYRKISEIMPRYNTVLFHGSVIALDGEAYLFTAKSGTGKSTHTRLWREVFGDRAVMINDDKPLLKITEDGVTAFGTPWNGKHHLGKNTSAPLKSVCFLERGKENEIKRVSASEVRAMLIQQMYRPSDPLALAKSLALLDTLTKGIGLYKLKCNISYEAVYMAYNGINGK